MRSRRWSILVSVFALALALGAGESARAQFGYFDGIPGAHSGSLFALGYGTGTGWGALPFDHGYGSIGAAGYGGSSSFSAFPVPGYRQSIGQRPLTSTSFDSVSNILTLVPGWTGPRHRMHRRH
jgi:hypothetical protein